LRTNVVFISSQIIKLFNLKPLRDIEARLGGVNVVAQNNPKLLIDAY
jgi:hypothetical protein